jgi:hypothetical protein
MCFGSAGACIIRIAIFAVRRRTPPPVGVVAVIRHAIGISSSLLLFVLLLSFSAFGWLWGLLSSLTLIFASARGKKEKNPNIKCVLDHEHHQALLASRRPRLCKLLLLRRKGAVSIGCCGIYGFNLSN